MLETVKSSSRNFRGRRLAGLLLLLALPILLGTGCTFTVGVTQRDHNLTGRAVFGSKNLLLDDATVTISGPEYKRVYTNVDGEFAAYNLTEGTYTITVTSLAGSISQKVYLTDNTDVTVRVPYPSWFNEETFLLLSGVWDFHVDESNNLVTSEGSGNWRWKLDTTVPVYINSDGLPPNSSWPNDVYNRMKDWPSYANNKIRTEFVDFDSNSGIEIMWVPAGTLEGGAVGSAEFLQLDTQGYLKSVLVAVDMDYGDILSSPTMGHEVLHAIGANHVKDTTSVLYPYVNASGSQRIWLNSTESSYLTYAFAIAPWQTRTVTRMAAASVEEQSIPKRQMPSGSIITVLNRPGKPSEVINGIPASMLKHAKLQKKLAKLQTQSQSAGFLWDQLGK